MNTLNVMMYLVLADPSNVLIPTTGFPNINKVLPAMKQVTVTEDGVETTTWVPDNESDYVGIIDRLKGLHASGKPYNTIKPSQVDKLLNDPWDYIGDDPLVQGRQYYKFEVILDEDTNVEDVSAELTVLREEQSAQIGRTIAKPEGALVFKHQLEKYFQRPNQGI